MKKFMHSILILVVASLGWSCKSSKILSATFEDDVINNPLATNLSGAPSGDAIEFHAAIQPQLKVQNSTVAGYKALEYTKTPINNPPPLSSQWVGFKGIETDLTQTLWFMYTAKGDGVPVAVDVSDGHGHLMARMHITSTGEVGLSQSIADNYSDVIGEIGSGTHTVVFTVFPSQLKYNVTIIKEAGGNIVAENRPMITDNALSFNNPAHPRLSILNESTAGDTYAIESVFISKKQPN